MQSEPTLSRRTLLTGIGSAGIMAAGGMGLALAADPATQDGASSRFVKTPLTTTPEAFGPVTVLELGGIDFHPIGSATYAYVSPGGVSVTSGSQFFNAGLPVPVGSRILTVAVYLNPNGVQRSFTVTRYKPRNPTTFENLASGTSTAGTAVEFVSMQFKHDVAVAWNYRISNLLLSAGGAIVYGARVRYRPPA